MISFYFMLAICFAKNQIGDDYMQYIIIIKSNIFIILSFCHSNVQNFCCIDDSVDMN